MKKKIMQATPCRCGSPSQCSKLRAHLEYLLYETSKSKKVKGTPEVQFRPEFLVPKSQNQTSRRREPSYIGTSQLALRSIDILQVPVAAQFAVDL